MTRNKIGHGTRHLLTFYCLEMQCILLPSVLGLGSMAKYQQNELKGDSFLSKYKNHTSSTSRPQGRLSRCCGEMGQTSTSRRRMGFLFQGKRLMSYHFYVYRA